MIFPMDLYIMMTKRGLGMEREEHLVTCWFCQADFDLLSASFCNHPDPTKICPYCLRCFCDASPDYKTRIREECSLAYFAQRNDFVRNRDSKLGEILVHAGKVTAEELDKLIQKQKTTGDKLGEILIREGRLSREELMVFLMEQKSIEYARLEDETIDYSAVDLLGREKCLEKKIIPLELSTFKDQKILRFGIHSKQNLLDLKLDRELKEYVLIPYLLNEPDMKEALQKIRDYTPNILILE